MHGSAAMATERITIEVDSEAARLYKDASPDEREKMQVLVSILLREVGASKARPFREVVDNIGGKARERGMTPEILSAILDR
jgi:hypothetical protein